MARYKGNYKDLFKDTATYTVDGKETKTVKGESNSTFEAGMGLTVTNGKLTIKADTLDETTTQWLECKGNWKKWETGWSYTKTYLAGNINLYGVFLLSTVDTNSIAGVIVSNGKTNWRNVNLVQLLFTVTAKEGIHENKTQTKLKNTKAGLFVGKIGTAVWRNKITRLI
ncbi:hypothetical protein EV681_2901 [Advenella incenata]|jgi:hypothetical protein|uniref:Uncharacterized protein n=1 Tax=Advenella incenata TaxID=267800 RepID=A0A4Q7VC85_9BURK|nr:hypothetical protein [Advenella incenata]RZT94481.1 hypothetical protein EV681_2901 [Advenella incenata]